MRITVDKKTVEAYRFREVYLKTYAPQIYAMVTARTPQKIEKPNFTQEEQGVEAFQTFLDEDNNEVTRDKEAESRPQPMARASDEA